jgi:hypothetical protein
MQTVDLPEDVLVIHYTALAPGSPPLVRLQILKAIGCLMTDQDRVHTVNDLLTDTQARLALQSWLMGEEASRFWSIEDGLIASRRACEKHVLVGTRHLLDDWAIPTRQPSRPQLADLDMLWQAADVFVNQHAGGGRDFRGEEYG